jgi:large conductance mechanosensitive channel
VDFSNLFVVLREGAKQPGPYASVKAAADAGAVAWRYGLFINSLVSFLIVAVGVFFLIRAVNRVVPKAPAKPAAPTVRPCPYCQMEISLKATRCPYCTSELKGR